MNRSLKSRYWKIVQACLVEIRGFTAYAAAARVRDFRLSIAKMAESSTDPYAAEMIYHEEAFQIALDLSGKGHIAEDADWKSYWLLLEKFPVTESRVESKLPVGSVAGLSVVGKVAGSQR